MDPGCWGVSGGKSAQSRGESWDKTTGCRVVCLPGDLLMQQYGTGFKEIRKYGAKGARERWKGEYDDLLYTPRTEANTKSASLSRSYFLGLKASGRATMGSHRLRLIRSPRPRPLCHSRVESHLLTPGSCRDCLAGYAGIAGHITTCNVSHYSGPDRADSHSPGSRCRIEGPR